MSESAPQMWRRTLSGYAPANDTAKAAWQKGKPGELVKMDVKRPRNLAHNSLLWVIYGMVVDNSETFTDARQVHSAVKAALGFGKWIDVGGSHPLFIEESTSFGSMSQVEFSAFFDAALKVIDRFWLSVGVETLLSEGKARS